MAKKRHKDPPSLKELLGGLVAQPPGDLSSPLEGYAYRFTVYLPLLSQGKEVFTEEHIETLDEFFNKRFQGYSATTAEGNPPWYGSWIRPGSEKAVRDKHMLWVVYTAQVEDAKALFQYLKFILELKHVAGQDVVVIEHTTVWLMKAAKPPHLSGLFIQENDG